VSVRFVNRPLAQLAQVAQELSRGETPMTLPERGPAEIRDMNIAFNRMPRDIRQNEADREIMLAGISHDLRTPLARMRLEIEMADISEHARHAIDEDMAQIDHTIGQLMEYARPANVAPRRGVNVSAIITEVYRRELSHTLAMGGRITANIQPDLPARINEYDLKRIVANLIENARRYGRNPEDDKAHIRLSVELRGGKILIQVADKGPGIAADDITQLLRPFSRGDT